jgi:hypothetical protein
MAWLVPGQALKSVVVALEYVCQLGLILWD